MAKQMMPRKGSVRHPRGPQGHGLRRATKGSPYASPRPSTGSRGMSPAGSFNSRPSNKVMQPKPKTGRGFAPRWGS